MVLTCAKFRGVIVRRILEVMFRKGRACARGAPGKKRHFSNHDRGALRICVRTLNAERIFKEKLKDFLIDRMH